MWTREQWADARLFAHSVLGWSTQEFLTARHTELIALWEAHQRANDPKSAKKKQPKRVVYASDTASVVAALSKHKMRTA